MWRTFYKAYSKSEDFDEFLNQIEAAGYDPVFMREAYSWEFKSGQRKLVIETMVTSRKKDA